MCNSYYVDVKFPKQKQNVSSTGTNEYTIVNVKRTLHESQ